MKEEKIDRLIRKTINKDYLSQPSVDFTESVMETLGVKRSEQHLVIKPMKQSRGLIFMLVIYLVIFVSIFFIPGALESYSVRLPEFQLPSLTKFLNLDSGMSRILIMLITGGWLLIFFDNYIRKFFTR